MLPDRLPRGFVRLVKQDYVDRHIGTLAGKPERARNFVSGASTTRTGRKPVVGDEVAVEEVAPDKPGHRVPHLRKRS